MDRAVLRGRGFEEIGLEFLGLQAAVVTDVPEVANYCRDLYRRFLAPASSPFYVLRILSDGDESWCVSDAEIDATVDVRSWLPGIATARLLESVSNEAADHDLFHGATLSRHGHGVILCGESGFGKSTLTLGLLGRGWKFFSEEVAAVHRQRRLLEPFPKAIEVRPGSAALIGLPSLGQARRGNKALHDAETLFPACMAQPCPVSAVVFLARQDHQPPVGPDVLSVTVHRRVDRLPEIVGEIDGVLQAGWANEASDHPVLAIRCDRRKFPTWELERVLGRRGVLILSSSAEETPPPDFSSEPRLEPIEASKGVQELLGRFRGRQTLPRRLAAHPGGFGGLFLETFDRFRDVSFHRLRIGRLDSTLELLDELVGQAVV